MRNGKRRLTAVLLVLFGFLSLSVQAEERFNSRALDKYIRKTMKKFEVVGLAVAVVKDSRVIFSKGYGFKDNEKKTRITGETLFQIASCTKAFTAACIAKLVEEGKLNWNDRVKDHLPGFELSDGYIADHLTVRDILCHRSGLGSFDGDLLWYRTSYDTAEVIRRMKYMPVRLPFRGKFGYQNLMFMVAGEIIKKAGGMSWADYLEGNFLEPLDMKPSSACYNLLPEGVDLALPHHGNNLYPVYKQGPNAAASIHSSVDRMAHWMMMLLNRGKWKKKQLLEPGSIDQLFAVHTAKKVSGFSKRNGSNFAGYGLGWELKDYYGEKLVEHSGGMPGYISMVTLVPGKNLGMVFLTNQINRVPFLLRYKVMDIFIRGISKPVSDELDKMFLDLKIKKSAEKGKRKAERKAARVKGTSPSVEFAKYVGEYEDKVYGKAVISKDGEQLVLTFVPTAGVFFASMEHWHYDTFRVRFNDVFLNDGFVNFYFDTERNIKGFKIDLPSDDFHFNYLDFKKIEK
ncbi:MAG: serine hydrolase [bacterium]|nr:serine hydrolase [bacterium]